jgi:hypothetical protein
MSRTATSLIEVKAVGVEVVVVPPLFLTTDNFQSLGVFN